MSLEDKEMAKFLGIGRSHGAAGLLYDPDDSGGGGGGGGGGGSATKCNTIVVKNTNTIQYPDKYL